MFPLISPPGGIECNSGHFLGLVYPQVVKLKQYLTVHEQLWWIGEIVYAMRTFPDTIHSFLSVGPDKSFWFWLVRCVRREIVH